MKLLTRIGFVLCLAIPGALLAHHGWAEFDSTKEVTLQGAVADFHFTNPHCVVEFRVKDDKGETHLWQGEFASPGELARRGWNAASLQPGDQLTVTGHPAKNGGPALHVTKIRLTAGKELPVPDSN